MQLSHELYLLVTCFVTLSPAIRVDWNTNQGPIVPPTPRTTVRPLPPFREPAPVWEDQSNDIPNPNPYIYILPPPSRPRPATNNYLTSDQVPATPTSYDNYGRLVAPHEAAAYYASGKHGNLVSGLAVKYVPNVGYKYYAVVPNGNSRKALKAPVGLQSLSSGFYGVNDKSLGKLNLKTKKYKAYEKVKYVPIHYQNPISEFSLPSEQRDQQFNQEEFIRTQQLPMLQAPQPFRPLNNYETNEIPDEQPQKQQQQQRLQQKMINFNEMFAKYNFSGKKPEQSKSVAINGIHDASGKRS